jgi:hypothetical protein
MHPAFVVCDTLAPAVSVHEPAQLASAPLAWSHTWCAVHVAAVQVPELLRQSLCVVCPESEHVPRALHVVSSASGAIEQVPTKAPEMHTSSLTATDGATVVHTLAALLLVHAVAEAMDATEAPLVSTHLWQDPHAVLALGS